MKISKELDEWLEKRDQLLTVKRKFFAEGGHISLRREAYVPEALDEPLRSEAISYFERLRSYTPDSFLDEFPELLEICKNIRQKKGLSKQFERACFLKMKYRNDYSYGKYIQAQIIKNAQEQ